MDRRQPEASSLMFICCVSEGTRLSGLCVTEGLGGETGSWISQALHSVRSQMGLTVQVLVTTSPAGDHHRLPVTLKIHLQIFNSP